MVAFGMTRESIPGRGLTLIALSLLLSVTGASAQSDVAAKREPSSSTKGVGTRALGANPKDARMNAWYEDCRKGWDAKTHMSKKDYDRTCRRMAHERIKFLKDQEKTRTRSQ